MPHHPSSPLPSRATPLLLFLLLLLLHVNAATTAAMSTSSLVPSTSASVSASANQRSARSVDPTATSAEREEEEEGDKDGCSSDFVENFFRLLSGPVGREGEAVVAAVLKLLSENDRVNWPRMAHWYRGHPALSRDLAGPSPSSSSSSSSSATTLRQMLADGARRARGDSEKRMAPKFNPTGWRRKRSTRRLPQQPLGVLLQGLLARLDDPDFLERGEDDFVSPKMAADLAEDDVKLVPEMAEWQEGKRSGSGGRSSQRRVSRRRQSQRMPKRKPLEFNPTGW
ncbi:uncharacterized protein LOC143275515 [Babylonia areolata]|uniref:uncharacterized protein LOC143275515 n=1 Tax=Babylonia areolata TaxID=304850 RepID=UPI003FD60843